MASIDRASLVSPSLEEQILRSRFIVLSSLLSATAGTETVQNGEGVAPTYRALNSLRFKVHEYLKGTGPAEAVVTVRGRHTYLTEAEARQSANRELSRRNTAWDNRQGVLFLNNLTPPLQSGSASGAQGTPPAPTFNFTLSGYSVETEWDYSIDTLSRAWLPAKDAPSVGGESGVSPAPAGKEFITDGSKSPPSVKTLAGIRSAIADMEATLKAGEGIDGYLGCIAGKIYYERLRRADPWTPHKGEATIVSGSASGTDIYRSPNNPWDPGAKYHRVWLSGPDKVLFQGLIDDADSNPRNGFDDTLVTARPLPSGQYKVFYDLQHYRDIPCNFKPADSYQDWTVTVTAPSGTLHEMFFDPVAAGSAVAADASNGTLKPRAFTGAGGASASISRIAYQSGQVKIGVTPDNALAGQTVDFIELDGTGSLSLSVASATVDAANDTLSWTVSSAPWADGDKLMVRIHNGTAPAPTPAPTATRNS